MKSIFIPAVVFQLLLHVVDAKHCTFIYETGYMKYFFCNAFEYCCGAMCCRSQAVTFYQVWYFWLIVFLTLLICSGGSWWYRFHRGPFINPSVTTSPITVATSGRPTIQPAGMMYGPSAHTSHMPYPVQQQQVMMPPQSQHPFPKTTAPPPTSPPPYYEAPPSYAAATMQTN